jgi:hypothetical protein
LVGKRKKNPNEPAASFEELETQLRVAEKLTKLLCDLVKEAETGASEQERLRAVAANLKRFQAAIGGDAAARFHLYVDMIGDPPKAVVPEAGSGADEAGADGARAGGARGPPVPPAQTAVRSDLLLSTCQDPHPLARQT